MVTERERISHIFRRLGVGAQPDLVAAAETTDDAIATALDLSAAPDTGFALDPPTEAQPSGDGSELARLIGNWLQLMVNSPRRIEERLVWFWHDHFATDIRKVRVPYLMHRQHETVRTHATGRFSDLLHGIATDPAMLIYLDGVQNQVGAINENFGREVMELFTLGRGFYTEDDVIAASRAFSGWVVPRPGGRAVALTDVEPWQATLVPFRHDDGNKTLLGTTGNLGATGAVDVLLEQDRTAEFIGAKLFAHLVGISPNEQELGRIATAFRREYSVLDLVEAIVSEPAFLSDAAVMAKVRTPVEKAVGVVQAFGFAAARNAGDVLRTMGYVPFVPPNVAGFPEGPALLDPHRLVHTFDLTSLLPQAAPDLPPAELMQRLGIYDISVDTVAVLKLAPDAGGRIALALNSPEYHLT